MTEEREGEKGGRVSSWYHLILLSQCLAALICSLVMSTLGVAGGLLVKALDYGSKDPGFQSHLQQRFISLLGALSPTSKIE